MFNKNNKKPQIWVQVLCMNTLVTSKLFFVLALYCIVRACVCNCTTTIACMWRSTRGQAPVTSLSYLTLFEIVSLVQHCVPCLHPHTC